MAGKVLKMNNMRNFNNSVIMNKSAENPTTTHTHNRSVQGKKRKTKTDKLLTNSELKRFWNNRFVKKRRIFKMAK